MGHLINKQIIQADIHQKLDVFDVQQQVSKFYYARIIKILERLFDELVPGETVVEFDRVELDVGQLQVGHLQGDYAIRDIERRIEEQVRKLIATGASRQSHALSEVVSVAKQWLFYMEHGYLAWNTRTVDVAWYDKVLEALAIDYVAVTSLRKLITSNNHAVERIFLQHPSSFLTSLVEILTAQQQSMLADYIDEISEVFSVAAGHAGSPTTTAEHNRKQYWISVLRLAAALPQLSTQAMITEMVGGRQSIDQLRSQLQSTFKHKKFDRLEELLNDLLSRDAPPGSENPVSLSTKTLTQDVDMSGLPDKSLSGNLGGEETPLIKSNAARVAEGVFVSNAGLVLLHPFLNSFFHRLGIVREGEFLSEESKNRALYLLHYLATGRMEAEEYELAMPKILCDFPLDEPVRPISLLHPDELDEAEQLLLAVIEQWSILQNTSPAGLREGFLQRNGKVFSKNNTIHLIVEAASIDMLLDHLPWNLAIVKLPWMDDLLKVEWR